mgnify:CR=1 FL=1
MALVISKKVKTILLIVLTILLVGGGGFLIWTVTREESIAPEDSEAAPLDGTGPNIELSCDGISVDLGYAVNQCDTSVKWGQFVCGEGCMSGHCNDDINQPLRTVACPDTQEFSIDSELPSSFIEGIYSITGLIGRGHLGQSQYQENFKLSIHNSSNDRPITSIASETTTEYSEDDGYWEGFGPLGTFHLLEDANAITMEHTVPCPYGDSPNSVHLYKLCLVQENICEGGDWENKPADEEKIPYGTALNPITI